MANSASAISAPEVTRAVASASAGPDLVDDRAEQRRVVASGAHGGLERELDQHGHGARRQHDDRDEPPVAGATRPATRSGCGRRSPPTGRPPRRWRRRAGGQPCRPSAPSRCEAQDQQAEPHARARWSPPRRSRRPGGSPAEVSAVNESPRAAAVDMGAVSRPVRMVSRAVSPRAIATRKSTSSKSDVAGAGRRRRHATSTGTPGRRPR